MIGKFFILSAKNIRHRKLRSWLTILGIIVGIALIVSLVSMGTGLQNSIMQQLKMFGGDLVTILPGDETNPMLGVVGGGTFRDKEMDAIKGVPGVNLVIPFDISYFPVEFKGEVKATTVHGSPIRETKEIYTENRGFGMEAGRWPSRENVSEAILGNIIANKKYKTKINIGDEIRVKGKIFKIVGVLKEFGSSEDDNAVYLSMYNLQKITGKKSGAKMGMARIIAGFNQESVAQEIKYRMRKVRGSADVTVLTSEKAQSMVGDILGTIQIAVFFIAIFSIIVGGIGVMNTMYTSVLERRREIGIMKAIGATKKNIWAIFIIESGMIGAIGGIIGLVIGLSLAKGAEIGAMQAGFKFLQAYISFGLVGGVLLFAFLLGALSGLLPAMQAAKLDPAEALRYE